MPDDADWLTKLGINPHAIIALLGICLLITVVDWAIRPRKKRRGKPAPPKREPKPAPEPVAAPLAAVKPMPAPKPDEARMPAAALAEEAANENIRARIAGRPRDNLPRFARAIGMFKMLVVLAAAIVIDLLLGSTLYHSAANDAFDFGDADTLFIIGFLGGALYATWYAAWEFFSLARR